MNECIYSVNLLVAALNGVNNYDNLSAAIEFADVNDSKSLSAIAQELDSFEYLPNVNDYELAVIKDGKPDFFEIQKISMMSNPIKIDMTGIKYPACFTAFDILYYEDNQVTDLPLLERKEFLQKAIKSENSHLLYHSILRKTEQHFISLLRNRS